MENFPSTVFVIWLLKWINKFALLFLSVPYTKEDLLTLLRRFQRYLITLLLAIPLRFPPLPFLPQLRGHIRQSPSLRSFSACTAASPRAFSLFTAAALLLFSSSTFPSKVRIRSCSCLIWVPYGFDSMASFTTETNAAALCDSTVRKDWGIERTEGVLMLDCLVKPRRNC